MFVLKVLTTNLVKHLQIFAGGWHRFCIAYRLRIARRMMDIAGVAKEQTIVREILNGLSKLAPVCQCIDRHFLAEFVRIMTSDEALFSPCFFKVIDMADLVLADDLARLVAFRRHLNRAFFKPEMLSEVRHELLELLAG